MYCPKLLCLSRAYSDLWTGASTAPKREKSVGKALRETETKFLLSSKNKSLLRVPLVELHPSERQSTCRRTAELKTKEDVRQSVMVVDRKPVHHIVLQCQRLSAELKR